MDMLLVKPNDFACHCGAEGQTRCDVVMQWALGQYKTTKEKLLDQAVWALHWQYGAAIDGIATDQWSRIDTKVWWDREEPFKTNIQCDDVLDGIAFTLKAYFDQFGEFAPYMKDEQ